jgi:hypothetical protein
VLECSFNLLAFIYNPNYSCGLGMDLGVGLGVDFGANLGMA